MPQVLLNSTASSAFTIDINYSWDDVSECDLGLHFSHKGDGEHEAAGALNVKCIWLKTSLLVNVEAAIRQWYDSPGFSPSGMRGTFPLAYFDQESTVTLSFDAGIDDQVNATLVYQLGSLNGAYVIPTDQSSMRIFAMGIAEAT